MADFATLRQMMVDCQIRPADVTRYALIDAMLWTPRERFVAKAQRELAYADAEIPLRPGRAMLAPRTLAKMIEAAGIGRDDLVLDVAPGLGYSTAVMSRLAAAVVAVEPDEAMAAQATEALSELNIDNVIVTSGPAEAGYSGHGPYDAILINGGVEAVPAELTDQLKDNGRLVAIFMRGELGQCRVLVRAGTAIAERHIFDAAAPLIEGFSATKEFAF